MSIIANLPPWFWIAIFTFAIVLGTVAYLILLERKVASWIQDRLGPNRVGPGGLLQPLADGLKMFTKEDYRPPGTDKYLFSLAPGLMMLVMIVTLAVLPWGGTYQSSAKIDVTGAKDPIATVRSELPAGASMVGRPRIDEVKQPDGKVHQIATVTYRFPFQIARLNIGVLFIIAVLSLAVYGVVIGGWAGNNKYSFLGGLRATAQMISYEIPLGLTLLAVVVMFGTLDLGEIVDKQAHYWGGFIPAWNIFTQPLGFVLFLICIHAEANRAPFDLPEAEQELVGGYHTEYSSSMRLGFLLLAEYAGMVTTSAILVALFLGGWHCWGLNGAIDPTTPSITANALVIGLRCFVYFVKVLAVIFIFMWVRWSLPRFRFDQLMMVAWRGMIPLSLALLMCTSLIVFAFGPADRAYMRVSGKMALALLGMNIGLTVVATLISKLLPAAPPVNRRLKVAGSRFDHTPLPATTSA